MSFAHLEKQYGLPVGLLSAVMAQESGGNPNAVSPAGAQGAFQFMPATAKQYGIDPFDTNQAAVGAAKMYSDLSNKYQGNLDKMLAGYNWGQGNVDRKGLQNAPTETRNYISSIKKKLGTEYADSGQIMNDATEVTDPALLEQLNAGDEITDPNILAQLNGDEVSEDEGNPFVNTFVQGLSDAGDFATFNYKYEDEELPAKMNLREKFKAGTATRQDYLKAFFEGGANSPPGKALSAIGGTLFNPITTAFSEWINPAIAEKTGLSEEDVAAMEMALPFAVKGVQAAKNVKLKSPTGLALDNTSGVQKMPTSPVETITRGEKKVLQRLYDDNRSPEGIQARLSRQPGATILDVGGENTRRLAEAVSNVPGKSSDTMNRFIEQRVSGTSKRIKNDINEFVSNEANLLDVGDAIMAEGQSQAAPLYKQAYAKKIPSNSKLNELMQRPALQKAAANAERIAANEGQMLSELQGSTKYFDYVKRGLDDVLEGYRDKTTGKLVLDTEGRAISNLRGEYIQTLDSLNPVYAKARKTASSYFDSKEALQSGKNFLSLEAPQLKRTYNALSETDKKIFKVGVAQSLRDMVNKAPDRSNVAKKIFGKEEYRQKLQAVLGADEFSKLRLSMMREDKMYQLSQKLAGNSRTALRQQEIKDLMQDPSDLVIQAATGNKSILLVKNVAQAISNRYQGLNRQTAAEIANILTERNPAKQQEIILRLQQRALADKEALKGYVILENIATTTGALPGALSSEGSPSAPIGGMK